MSSLEALSAHLAGRDRVQHELGRCDMATVSFAEHLRHRRKVARKMLHPRAGSP